MSGTGDGHAYRASQADVQEHDPSEAIILDRSPGSGSLTRTEIRRDSSIQQWGVVTPSATVIGQATSPAADLSESIRRLHDEQHTATKGHSVRAHKLDRLRTTHALCNAIDLTAWQRDLALGVMERIDLTEFGSQRGIPIVALVVIRHVVDMDRRAYFGLDTLDASSISSDRLETLFDHYKKHDIVSDETFQRLASMHGLDTTSLNRLRRVLLEQLPEGGFPAFGRNPHRDPNLPHMSD